MAARADLTIRYVTTRIAALVNAGLLPEDHGLSHGDHLIVLVDGKLTIWKVNRANGTTLAAHLPTSLPLPEATADGLLPRVYHVIVLGPLADAEVEIEEAEPRGVKAPIA